MKRVAPGFRTLTSLALGASLVACGVAGPVALDWGVAGCTHCHMTLADKRFGAEVITTHGRALPFDDVGCAANHLVSGETPPAPATPRCWCVSAWT